jgi:hypothetical protein
VNCVKLVTMKSFAVAAISTLAVVSTSAFTSPMVHTPVLATRAFSSTCEIPEEFSNNAPTLSNATPIRSAVVTNYEGDFLRIDDVIQGNNPHIVVYLRHMG